MPCTCMWYTVMHTNDRQCSLYSCMHTHNIEFTTLHERHLKYYSTVIIVIFGIHMPCEEGMYADG